MLMSLPLIDDLTKEVPNTRSISSCLSPFGAQAGATKADFDATAVNQDGGLFGCGLRRCFICMRRLMLHAFILYTLHVTKH